MLKPTPLTHDEANRFIVGRHRHHGRVVSHRFIVGASARGELVGVAVVGRPRARRIEQFRIAEVTRLCSDGSKNVCSFLYSRCSRVSRELGFAAVFTAILLSESGVTLHAAGWRYVYTTRGGSQDRPSRRRVDRSPTEPKQIWAPAWCVATVARRNATQARRTARRAA